MRTWKTLIAVALVALACLGLYACGGDQNQTGGDINIFLPPVPSPSAAPSVSPSGTPTTGAPAKVKTTQFGEDCPAGTQPAPGDRDVRAGCTIHLTCTPTDIAGNDLGGQIPAPDSFAALAGADLVEVSSPGTYNRDVKAKPTASGLAVFRCIVRGVPNENDFVLGVIQ